MHHIPEVGFASSCTIAELAEGGEVAPFLPVAPTHKLPVFVLGCPRSGTSFLYHLLVAAGSFASFDTQMNVYDVLEPVCGNLKQRRCRESMFREWLASKAYLLSHLDARELNEAVLTDCRSGGEFLRTVMDAVARRQGTDCWIDSTPTNIPHMLRIAQDFPEARFLHIIRDGRDVALSLVRRGWARPLPGDNKNALSAAGIYWEWMVQTAREHGHLLGPRYMEVRYEELVADPRIPLRRIARFLAQDIDCDRIAVFNSAPTWQRLTSFPEEVSSDCFAPVGRWKRKFPRDQLARFEQLVGGYLLDLGYRLSESQSDMSSLSMKGLHWRYTQFYRLKQWAKIHTPLSRWLVSYAETLIDK